MNFMIKLEDLFYIIFLISSVSSSDGAAYDYFQNGNDWEGHCAEVL